MPWKKAKPPHFGIRVRLLKKVDREDPLNLAWAVEEGLVSYGGDVWTEKRIVSRHASKDIAVRAMSEILRTRAREGC